MSKTIKQLADEIGVSKTAIRKKMTDEVKTKFAETVSGVIYIDEQGEMLIKQAFYILCRKPKFSELPQTSLRRFLGKFPVSFWR